MVQIQLKKAAYIAIYIELVFRAKIGVTKRTRLVFPNKPQP